MPSNLYQFYSNKIQKASTSSKKLQYILKFFCLLNKIFTEIIQMVEYKGISREDSGNDRFHRTGFEISTCVQIPTNFYRIFSVYFLPAGRILEIENR